MCNFIHGQTITGLVSFENSYYKASNVIVLLMNGVKKGINGTFTDSTGNYSIQISSSTKRIHFGSIGYESHEIDINDIKNDTVINVTLREEPSVLEGLVVTAKMTPREPPLVARAAKKSGGFFRKRKIHYTADIVREAKEPELINIEKQWALINDNSLSFWSRIIFENITYPDKMLEYGIQGRVLVRFKINVDGDLDDLKIIRGFNSGIDEEVLRVLKLSPSWSEYQESGLNFNQLVSARRVINYFEVFILPITFEIETVKN